MERKILKYGLVLLFFSLFVNLGTLTLHHEEPRRGIITFEMLKTGNFLQPTVLGEPYFKKPPLHNWATSFTSFLAGHVSEFTLRIPSVLGVLFTSLLIYWVVARLIDRRLALFSALVYPTFFVVLFGYSTKCEPDTLFSLFVSLSVFLWIFFMEKGEEGSAWFLGYLFTSFALLTKGLPALHFFWLSVFAYFLVKRNWDVFFSLKHFTGLLFGLLPFLGWLFSVDSSVALKVLVSEVLARSPESHSLLFTVKRYLSFPFRFLAATFPWSLVVGIYLLRERSFKRVFENQPVKVFLLSTVLNVAVYWIFPGSRLRYVMPALPMLSVVVAYYLADYYLLHKRAKKIFQFFLEISVPFLIVLGVAVSKDSSLILKETIAFLAFSYFFYFYVLPKINFTPLIVFTFFLTVLVRGIYSCYFIPVAEEKYPPYREEGKKVAALTKGYPLFTKTKYLQFCFYVESNRGEVLKFKPNPPKNSLFLSENKEGNVLYEAKVGKKSFYLCSYSFKRLKSSGKTLEAEPKKEKSQ